MRSLVALLDLKFLGYSRLFRFGGSLENFIEERIWSAEEEKAESKKEFGAESKKIDNDQATKQGQGGLFYGK
ncbi:hypothetical protein SDJN02_25808, partial [Cucurbita argyrosperma subsp. argyrosperma]